MIEKILGWIRSITEIGLSLIALGVVLQILFGAAVPFIGLDVIGSVVGLVKQLGLEPMQFAKDLIEREGGPEKCVKPFSKKTDVPGPYKGKGNKNEWGERLSVILTNLMSKDIATIHSTSQV